MPALMMTATTWWGRFTHVLGVVHLPSVEPTAHQHAAPCRNGYVTDPT